MRLAMQADKGYTHLKLNDQIVEGDVTVTQGDLNTWKT
jgi:lipopolysaccharide export system protein LptA